MTFAKRLGAVALAAATLALAVPVAATAAGQHRTPEAQQSHKPEPKKAAPKKTKKVQVCKLERNKHGKKVKVCRWVRR